MREGDAVPAGATLLRQELGSMQARLDQAVAARNVAERRLAELVKGPRAQEITEARAALESARSMLETETNEYQRVQDLVDAQAREPVSARPGSVRGATAPPERTSRRLRVCICCSKARASRKSSRPKRRSSRRRPRWSRCRPARRATSSRRRAQGASKLSRTSWASGRRAGAPLIVMLADGTPYARVYVPEPLRTQFLPGTRTRVHVDGRDGELTGVVRFVSADAAFTPYYALTQEDRSRLAYLAEIDLDEQAAANVPTGMPVQVELADGRR